MMFREVSVTRPKKLGVCGRRTMWGMEERECRKEMENTSPFKLG
jgi:hypothetical protein